MGGARLPWRLGPAPAPAPQRRLVALCSLTPPPGRRFLPGAERRAPPAERRVFPRRRPELRPPRAPPAAPPGCPAAAQSEDAAALADAAVLRAALGAGHRLLHVLGGRLRAGRGRGRRRQEGECREACAPTRACGGEARSTGQQPRGPWPGRAPQVFSGPSGQRREPRPCPAHPGLWVQRLASRTRGAGTRSHVPPCARIVEAVISLATLRSTPCAAGIVGTTLPPDSLPPAPYSAQLTLEPQSLLRDLGDHCHPRPGAPRATFRPTGTRDPRILRPDLGDLGRAGILVLQRSEA